MDNFEKHVGMKPYRSEELAKEMEQFAKKSYAELTEEVKINIEAQAKELLAKRLQEKGRGVC